MANRKSEKSESSYNHKEGLKYLKPEFWLDPSNQFWNDGYHNVEKYMPFLEKCRNEAKPDLIIHSV